MGHHILRRAINLTFAFLLAVFSVNLSGVLSLQSAYAANGNNGTVKIAETEASDDDDSNANDPHITGCDLNVKFYGYDEGQRTATVTFEAQAPTAGQLVSPIGPQAVTFTGLGGGGDTLDYTQPYTLAFSGAPQQNQGYHVKITVHADGSKGNDTKHKTVWVEGCEPTSIKPTVSAQAGACALVGAASSSSVVTVSNTDDLTDKTVTYAIAVDGQTTQTITLADGASGTRTFSGLTAGTYNVTITGDDGTSNTTSFTIATCPPTPVATKAPTKGSDKCSTTNDTYIIPDVAGVDYYIGNVLQTTGEHSTNGALALTITAVAQPNYTLTGTSSWTLNFTNTTCPIEVVPTAPTLNDECSVLADKYVIPQQTGVRYEVKIGQIGQNEIYAPISAGTYSTLGASSVKIRAIAKNGYVLTGGVYNWTLNFDTAKCQVIANVTPHEVCGANDNYTIPSTAHVTYKLATTKWFYFMNIPLFQYTDYDTLPAGIYPASGTVTIKAFADLGYEIISQDTWTFNFDSNKCDQPFDTEGDPIFSDQCGTVNDSYTIEPAQGVTYRVNGNIVPAGFYPNASGSIAITAEASDANYVLTGVTEWSHEFSTASCAAITATAMCNREGVIVTLTNEGDTDGSVWVNGDEITVPGNSSEEVIVPLTLWKASVEVYNDSESPLLVSDFDCTPGRGGIGGDPQDPPVTPKPIPAIPTGVVLPQTGSDKNPVVQLVSVVVAGLLAYGMVFALINRRDLISNE